MKVLGSIQSFAAAIGLGGSGGIAKLQVGGDIFRSTLEVGGAIAGMKIKGKITDSTFKVGAKIHALAVERDITNSIVQVGTSIDGLIVLGSFTDSELRAPGGLVPKNGAKAKAIGGLAIGGSMIRSRVFAGYNSAGPNGFFGDDDELISGGNAVIAKIAREADNDLTPITLGGTNDVKVREVA